MKNKIILLVSFFTVVFSLVSCLKDNVGEYWKDDLAGKMYATVAVPTLQQLALSPVPGDVKYDFLLNIATDALPAEDITVTLAIDPAAVTAYNARTGKKFQPFPNIEILTKTVLIAKGTRNATASAKVWGAEKLDACANFMAAISIASAKTASGADIAIAGNMKSNLTSLPISNPYAGNYAIVQGYRIRPGNATEPVAEGTIEAFKTVDCKTVSKVGFGNYSAYSISIEVTSETVVVGGTTCFKVIATPFDPATGNSVGGMWPAWTGDATLAPADKTINYYYPLTNTLVLNCYYVSGEGNRIMYEVLTRQ